jgi:hypothetical protein
MATNERKDYQGKMESQLRDAGEELDNLWMRARALTGLDQLEIHKMIAPLRRLQSAARVSLGLLRSGGDAAWQTTRIQAEKDCSDLGFALGKELRRLK